MPTQDWHVLSGDINHLSYLTPYNRSQGHTECIQMTETIQNGSHNSQMDMDIGWLPQLDNKSQADIGLGMS